MEIDGTYRLAVQTRVEQPLRIPQLGTFWKRQPYRVLKGLADADDAVVGPDGHPLGAGGLLPLHLFDYARVGVPDESPQLAQPLTPPASRPADYVIYLLERGCVAHFDALLRMLSTHNRLSRSRRVRRARSTVWLFQAAGCVRQVVRPPGM